MTPPQHRLEACIKMLLHRSLVQTKQSTNCP
jgi:hypothetical protein